MASLLRLLAIASLAALASACIVPPSGCSISQCDKYVGILTPSKQGDWSNSATGLSNWKKFTELAFVRGSFNKLYASTGPAAVWKQSDPVKYWKNFKKGYGNPKHFLALQYETYKLESGNYSVEPSAKSVSACCHACRQASGCALFFYVPPDTTNAINVKSDGGTCYFLKGGSSVDDGPFSPDATGKLINIGIPKPASSSGQQNPPSGYAPGFLGGYCNPNITIINDPHFTGAHGTRFDFNGELDKPFCLLTDKNLHLNAVLRGYKSDNTVGATRGQDGKAIRSWIKEIGLMWTSSDKKSHALHLVARSGKESERGDGFLASASYDGNSINIPEEAGRAFSAGDLTLTFKGTTRKGWYAVDNFDVVIGKQLDLGFSLRVAHPKLQSPTDAEVHFNLMFNDVKVTESVHGVLGQTYRDTPDRIMRAVKYTELSRILGAPVKADGTSGAGFLDGAVSDYKATHVLRTDCKVSAFSS